jgi:hypothetical protein
MPVMEQGYTPDERDRAVTASRDGSAADGRMQSGQPLSRRFTCRDGVDAESRRLSAGRTHALGGRRQA